MTRPGGPPGPVALATLLDALPGACLVGPAPATVAGLTDDSRQVVPGGLFVAVRGLRVDGRRFAAQALARGAAVVVAEPPDPAPGLPGARLLIPDGRAALARLAAAWFGDPSRDLTVIGVTGTNGKTTTTYLVEALLRAQALEPGVIGTIAYRFRGQSRPAGQTTPDPLELQGLLAEIRAGGGRAAVMEVSSHALAQSRVDGVAFDVAVFTNLTQDHLDFHGTMEAYAAAKGRLFFELLRTSGKPDPVAVLNGDDPVGARWARELPGRVLTFGLGPGCDVRPRRHGSTLAGIELLADTPGGPLALSSPLIGEHNVMNLLGAVGVGLARGLAPARVAHALATVAAVPGRLERIEAGQPFLVVVDYAHTPDALRRVLEAVRPITAGRVGIVFGAGGDRDRGKRPLMGRVAATLADRAWLTSDNPRSEEPVAIIREIAAGLEGGPAGGAVQEPDRRAAIADALAWARAGDAVVVAGKGHEPYQVIGDTHHPFNDRGVVREILGARLGASPCPA